ncbi:MAG: sensor histidine kinase YesM [Saprospiraceae bacterium]|jgi:sensor histidine kinase YesM
MFHFVGMNFSINQRIVWQVLIWGGIFLGLPFLISGGQMSDSVLFRSVGTFCGILIFIPLNLKLFFSKFYVKGEIGKYTFISILSVIIISLCTVWLHSFFEIPNRGLPEDIRRARHIPIAFFLFLGSIFPLSLVLLSSTLYEMSILANQSARETAQLKAEKLEAELKFLKSQINPHFLFNSLNNIYTLTVLNPKAAGDSLLKLSEMLRYLLYECDAEKVTLGRELAYLQNYIDLFSLKDEEALHINFDVTDVDNDIMIAPLLFIPFIENAFKHSQVEDLENGWINIILFGDTEQVYFEIKNSLPKIDFSKDKVGGIGLQNVNRQLELVYPKRHTLNINKTETEFSVELTILL